MATIEKRISAEGEITYRVKIRIKGTPEQTATFERLTDAKRWTQQTEAAIREGRYFKTSEAKRHTLADAIVRYQESVLPSKPKSFKDQLVQLNWWKDAIGAYSLADITPALLAEHRDLLGQGMTTRGKPRSHATINRYLAAISHVFTIAIKEWGWLENNPILKLTKMREPRGRVRFLSDDERERLLKVCRESKSQVLYPFVVLALSTGARKMELLGMHWPQVDLTRGVITLHETKNGERRVLPLTGYALNLMKEHARVRQLSTDLVFPAHNLQGPIDLRKPWETALTRAGIKEFRLHDLRHSAASYLAMNGASLAEIAEVLGHKTLHMVKRYAHLSEAHTMGVVERMNKKIFGG